MHNQDFVHLHLHTDYSLLDGAIQVKPLAKRITELAMRSCAITDHGNLYGAMSFYHAMKNQGIKPIIGCEVYITRGSRLDRERGALATGEKVNYHLILLARDLEGYHNLIRLTSRAYTEGFYYKPRIDRELLAKHSRGLIGLSACMSGIPSALLARGACEEAEKAALEFEEILGKGSYYLEIQDHELEAQRRIHKPLVELSRRTGIPLVATNDAHYLNPEDHRAHDVLLCIGSGKTVKDPNRLRYGSPNFYVRSAKEMWSIFGEELPEVLTRTLDIADMCQLSLPEGANHLPVFPIPEAEGHLTLDEYFEKMVRNGYEKRRDSVWEQVRARGELRHSLGEYQERISSEIAMIKRMGFSSYFLIVWDFIKYARDHGIPVGPGRGSAAGSLVAYCLEITDVDPLQYNLLFERFLNPDRVSMPDIDIDFCVRGRDKVIQHVSELYGRDSVCQIITFGTLASKAAIKDVGRALDMPYVEVERIAKMIPPPVRGRNVSITQALEQVPELRGAVEDNPQVKELIDLARRLEGCARHASVHAAGVVISPAPLEELVPIAVSSRDELTTQYAMSDLEKTGMLKMDFLALTALTVISDCLNTVKQSLNARVDWSGIKLDDALTMKLFAEGRTEAVFQFESTGMQEICRRLKPQGLEDLAALNALYRPGPLDGGMVDDFIERHHGHKSVRYIVPEMKEILSNTYGIIVYQEQIMQLAQKLAGFSLGEADLMRRAMGKKKREEMALHEEHFLSGAGACGMKPEKAQQIFKLMAQFADYGFNRSHSVAYAYLAFQTAYLKAHFPEHFYAAVLSNELENSEKLFKYSNELRGQGIRLLPPDVNESGAGFTPLKGAIRFGLEAIKGVGHSTVIAIIEARRHATFTSIFDFAERVCQRALTKRVLESLVSAGAFDSLNHADGMDRHLWRAKNFAAVDNALALASRAQKDKTVGQSGLFSSEMVGIQDTGSVTLPNVETWSHTKLLVGEKSSIGFYITGHPLENYEDTLKELNCVCIANLSTVQSGTHVQVGGIVTSMQTRVSKKGDRFALFRLEDQVGGVKCVVWPEAFKKYKNFVEDDAAVLISGRPDSGEETCTVIVDEIHKLDDVLQRRATFMLVRIPQKHLSQIHLQKVWRVLERHRGECEVMLEMMLGDGVWVKSKAHGALRVTGSYELQTALQECGCQIEWLN
ncbi:MAG: DNA polymerase III subunit alpha [Pyrinomonadaceae bacterium]|nr:DNA polymerase III subunit alpha [Pyrinomonadaceae bacterium]